MLDIDVDKLLASIGLNEGGRIQKRIDAAVIRYMEDYTPMVTGELMDNVRRNTVIGSGILWYDHPGARYLYYGEVYGPNIPIYGDDSDEPMGWWSPPGRKKYPTGRKLTYNQDAHALAGSFWFDRAMADHKKDVIKEALK